MLTFAWINSIIHVIALFTCIYSTGVCYFRTVHVNVPFLVSCVGIVYGVVCCIGMAVSGNPVSGNIYLALISLISAGMFLYDSRLIYPRLFN